MDCEERARLAQEYFNALDHQRKITAELKLLTESGRLDLVKVAEIEVESAIEKAYEMNQHSHRVHGASTISQQVAKNLFLWSGRSYFRKGLEAYFTVLIEVCWPKRRILEIYLNIAEFGYGTYGAEAAAQRFFHTSAATLTRSDSALLAAVLPNPQRLIAAAPSAYVQQRRDWILGQMQALGGPEMPGEIDTQPSRRR